MKLYLRLLFAVQFISISLIFAQSKNINGWQLADPDSGKRVGTAVNTIYSSMLNGKKSSTIIVAVLDNGTDTSHIDLIDQIWNNPNEIAGNGIDDDRNGYIDDTHGWNFLGTSTYDNIELTRLYKLGKEGLPKKYSWKEIRKEYKIELKLNQKNLKYATKYCNFFDDLHKKSMRDSITLADIKATKPHGLKMILFKKLIYNANQKGFDVNTFEDQIREGKGISEASLKYHLNTNFNSRLAVNDHPEDLNERIYGNADVTGYGENHGTHVAGIIAATRNNNIGMDGITNNVKIMVVRVIPNGDERDKDVANGIRYAVDNGAKLLNMSFGKYYSPNQPIVEQAIQYANSKGVLIIHGSGNESNNNDLKRIYPNAFIENQKTRVTNWIEVGASTIIGNPAYFSNYGKSSVDVFAPGTEIYSTIPQNKFEAENGTSMACPVVCGVAALIWSYFPNLTANELKNALLAGVQERDTESSLPGKPKEKIKFSSLCESGGIINAKSAFLKAEETSKNK